MKSKKIIMALLSFGILFSISFGEMNLPEPTDEFFVNDFANVITEADEQAIFEKSKSLYEATGNSTQVVVATVNSLDGYSVEEYANALFRKWGIGSKDKNDGVLILLAVQDRKSRIEVGYGLEGVLTDGGTGKIQDEYMLPYYKEDNFSEGLKSGASKIVDVIN